MEINSSEWYEGMKAWVSIVLETLVELDAAFVGYITATVEGQPITLSWTQRIVTVTSGEFKWQMPIGWFVKQEVVDRIVEVRPQLTDVRTETAGQPSVADFVQPEIEPGEGEENDPDFRPVGMPAELAHVRSAAEIMAEGLGED